MEINGGGKDGYITTTHISIFQIESVRVKVTSDEIPIIDENDVVAVAGKLQNGSFNAYAYKNMTTGASGNEGIVTMFLFAAVFPVVGIFTFFTFSNMTANRLPEVISLLFVCIGAYMFYKGMRVFKALSLLKIIK